MKPIYFLLAIWAMLVWLTTLLIFSILYLLVFLLGGKQAERTAHKVSRLWAWVGLTLSGIQVKVHNRQRLDSKEVYVFISNHRSQLDIPTCARSTDHFFKFLAKEELTKIPILGYIIKRLYITVNRGSVRDRVLSLQKMKKALEEGTSVWIYPEGTRNTTDAPIKEFQDGAFRLAIDAGRPIAIAALVDTGKHLPAGEVLKFVPGRVDVYWAEPISTVGMSTKDAGSLKERVRETLENMVAEGRAKRA